MILFLLSFLFHLTITFPKEEQLFRKNLNFFEKNKFLPKTSHFFALRSLAKNVKIFALIYFAKKAEILRIKHENRDLGERMWTDRNSEDSSLWVSRNFALFSHFFASFIFVKKTKFGEKFAKCERKVSQFSHFFAKCRLLWYVFKL